LFFLFFIDLILNVHGAKAEGQLSEENIMAGAQSLEKELARQSKSVFEMSRHASLNDMKAL